MGIGQLTRKAIMSDLSESNLREAPVVPIGSAGTDLWTAKLTNGFRFLYAMVTSRQMIRSRHAQAVDYAPQVISAVYWQRSLLDSMNGCGLTSDLAW
ncbi:hypothetical protein GCM10011586_39900 [Silvibacterium dinghuense]|uniref:hypothetical protein n=1 Tax=Silvibacterium dinghuense TaxID=1560006 RepID=UPI00100F4D21|nr:hypothetical protein [Silvibacterium dinghuense]GGH17404.1 hypothetical protein GCM10011586_39900 [Silvibacterium dinghuense]